LSLGIKTLLSIARLSMGMSATRFVFQALALLLLWQCLCRRLDLVAIADQLLPLAIFDD